MKIGLVCPYDLTIPGGVQQQVIELARLLTEAGEEAVIIGPGARRYDGIDLGGTISIPGNQSRSPISIDPAAVGRIRRAMKVVDLAHIHEPLMPVVGWAALTTDVPAVATFHAAKPDWATILYRFVPARVWRRRVLTAVSPVAADLGDRFGPVEIIPLGLNTSLYRTGVQRHRQQVAFLGRDDPRKGFPILDAAWSRVREFIPNAELVVIGIEGTTKLTIRYLGRVDETTKTRTLQASEIFVAPNLSGESFGLALAEGMAAGCAVIASDLEAFRAVTAGTARLVPPGDSEHLATALIDLLRSPEATTGMGKRARARAADFDWSHVLGLYRQAYQRAIETHSVDR